ncbi:helix-turn-helix transcriptional regulator [Danxiaibacter flavus]|uniref:Helix-turn-helix transcriptional regulator n=1 Tax=Danxiaibacter flavus TaxID=3049108 RepID=A0ABV3Z9R9_9BACT|nr:helix-turn-helix transcriptional regulator [Chitinophagaceae bacterium DXS]
MLEVNYNQTNFEELLKHFSRTFKVKVKTDTIYLPEDIGEGYFRIFSINGLEILISNYTLKQNVLFKRNKIAKEIYTFRFDEMLQETGESSPKSSVLLSCTTHDWLFLHPAGVHLNSASVIISKEWLHNFLGSEESANDIRKFLMLQTNLFIYEPLDAEYKTVLTDLICCLNDKRFEQLSVFNRIMLLIERFFTRILYKINETNFDVKVSTEDIERLKKVEAELLKDFTAEPLSINKLAKLAAMSPTKLKSVFKEIYGIPIYQYFQKSRMNKAKAMLLSKKYSVKEVGLELGYTNMSNFAKAFSKSFGQLPSEVSGK